MSKWQKLKRDLRVFARLFPWRVSSALVIGIALMAQVYQCVHNQLESTDLSYVKAVYAMLNMMTFQISFADMPANPRLDIFFVIVPLFGVPLLLVFGANVLNVLRILFVPNERAQRWQNAFASTIERPIVICGLGRVGYRIAEQLLELEQAVIGVDAVPSPLINTLIERGMPVIIGDIRNADILRSANVAQAKTVLVCTHNDLANIEATHHVRMLNPDTKLILRLFEDEIANEIRKSFHIQAVLSRSAIAAQAFAYAALGVQVLETFNLNGISYFLAQVDLPSALAGQDLGTVTDTADVTAVCLSRAGELINEPNPQTTLCVEDTVIIFAAAANVQAFTHPQNTPVQPVIVCGLGHTGYRIVNALLTLGCQVTAMAQTRSDLGERLRERGVTVIYDDFRQRSILLEKARVHEATAIITCTEDDMVNFSTGLRAREISPTLRVVMRIFEDALGTCLQETFHINAVHSTSAIAAPAFISEALNIHMTQAVSVGQQQRVIARLEIETLSSLYHERIKDLNAEEDLTLLLHKRGNKIDVPPLPEEKLVPDDEIVILASKAKLRALSSRNRPIKDVV